MKYQVKDDGTNVWLAPDNDPKGATLKEAKDSALEILKHRRKKVEESIMHVKKFNGHEV